MNSDKQAQLIILSEISWTNYKNCPGQKNFKKEKK